MVKMLRRGGAAAATVWLVAAAAVVPAALGDPVNSTTCNGKHYAYQELAGYGLVSADARDKYGDTIGGHGSAIAMDAAAWSRGENGTYAGVLYTLPDRGW